MFASETPKLRVAVKQLVWRNPVIYYVKFPKFAEWSDKHYTHHSLEGGPVIISLMPSDTYTALLRHALIGYEERKAEITATIARLRSTLQGTTPAPSEAKPRRKRGIMSPAARKRMALMMKQRWAKAKKAGKSRLG